MSKIVEIREKSVNNSLPKLIAETSSAVDETDIDKIRMNNGKFEKFGIVTVKANELRQKEEKYYKQKRNLIDNAFLQSISKIFGNCEIIKYEEMVKFFEENGLYVTPLGRYRNTLGTDALDSLESWERSIRKLYEELHTQNARFFKVGTNLSASFYKPVYRNIMEKSTSFDIKEYLFSASSLRNIDQEWIKNEPVCNIGVELFYDIDCKSVNVKDLHTADTDMLVVYSTFLFNDEIYCCMIDGYDESPEDDI